jgi:hypothetical protein
VTGGNKEMLGEEGRGAQLGGSTTSSHRRGNPAGLRLSSFLFKNPKGMEFSAYGGGRAKGIATLEDWLRDEEGKAIAWGGCV